ncbi:hypothetical protein Tco_0575615 [Tanacetum coccineum]
MDQKLEYQTFRAKPSESLSHTYTHYKTLLNELSNDGVTLSKHEINDFQEKSDDGRRMRDPCEGRRIRCGDESGKGTGFCGRTNSLWERIMLAMVERLNPDSKLPKFNTGRILVPKRQAVNECLQLTEAPTPLVFQRFRIRTSNSCTSIENLQRASPSSEIMTLTYQDHSPRERSGLGTMKYTKPKTQESLNKSVSGPVTISDNEPVTSSVPTKVNTRPRDPKIQGKALPIMQSLCFNNHRPDDCRNYPECEICGSYDHLP